MYLATHRVTTSHTYNFRQSSSHRMELVIIALIAVEVVIVSSSEASYSTFLTEFPKQALIRDGPELWDMVQGKHSKEETPKLA